MYGPARVTRGRRLRVETRDSCCQQLSRAIAGDAADLVQRARDQALNVEPARTLVVRVDLTDPAFWNEGIEAIRVMVEEEEKLAREVFPEKVA